MFTMVLVYLGGCSVEGHPEVTIEMFFVLEGSVTACGGPIWLSAGWSNPFKEGGEVSPWSSLQALPLTLSKPLLSSAHWKHITRPSSFVSKGQPSAPLPALTFNECLLLWRERDSRTCKHFNRPEWHSTDVFRRHERVQALLVSHSHLNYRFHSGAVPTRCLILATYSVWRFLRK